MITAALSQVAQATRSYLPFGPIWTRRSGLPTLTLLRSLSRQVVARRLTLVLFDSLLILASVCGAFALRLQDRESVLSFLSAHANLLPLALLTGLPVLIASGWYRGLTRYAGSHSLYSLAPRSGLMVLVLLLTDTLLGGSPPPRSFWLLFWLLFTAGAISSRIVMRDLLVRHTLISGSLQGTARETSGTLIYGAGSAGMMLLQALRNDPQFRIVGFLDDDRRLHGRTLQSLSIHSPEGIQTLIKRHNINQVLLAIPSLERTRKRLLVDQLTHSGLKVSTIPSLAQLATGRRGVTDLQPIAIEDLLGREPSSPDPRLLEAAVRGKAVLVTGAGGSIGSELCRQIIRLGALRLLLVERSEYALYSIESELRQQARETILVPVLGDAADPDRLTKLCRDHGINTLFHAAAYKHVPMVEANLCAGVANNIHATRAVIQAALASSVERLTLISTDKAVRPTNAMGASKRICELLIQAAAADIRAQGIQGSPILSMVRFGNVLGSSGSVIPRFHQQISQGGPVTVTHPAITRYFMTIPEAVQLVLQATGMAEGGDLFLLDMGEPVRIADLARQMVELSGLRVRDTANPRGDIAIEYTGLRPGEKLYEELLISDSNEPTRHPLIRRANEPHHPSGQLKELLVELDQALIQWEDASVIRLMLRLVPEYKPDTEAA